MFIQELHVDGYGVLRDVRVSFDTPITVVYGPNEAGKTTLLRFIRSMLYGIPKRNDLVERGEPVFGGRHGGWLAVRTAGGRELLVERYADGGSGAKRRTTGGLAVRDADGTVLDWMQTVWEQQAMGGVSERLFRQLFAVSLNDLHELLTLEGEEISNFLYHAGLAGGAVLSDARRKLTAEMDKLYRPKGSTQELNRLLASMKDLEAEIRESRGQLAYFRQTEQELDETCRRLDALSVAIPQLTLKAASLQDALDRREWWLKRQALLREERELQLRMTRSDLPPLSEQFAAEWAVMIQRRHAARERLEKASHTVKERRMERQALRWDASLLDCMPELERLDAMRAATAARQDEKEAAQAELHLLNDSIDMLLLKLSAEWTEADLRRFIGITSEKEPLRKLQHVWNETVRTRDRLEADAGRIRRQREALLEDRDVSSAFQHSHENAATNQSRQPKATQPFGSLRPNSRKALQTAWNALEDEVRQLEKLRSESLRIVSTNIAGSRRSGRRNRIGAAPWLAVCATLAALAVWLAVGNVGGDVLVEAAVFEFAIAGLCAALAIIAGRTAWTQGRGAKSQAVATDAAVETPVFELANAHDVRLRAESLLGDLLVDADEWAVPLLDGSNRMADSSKRLNEDAWIRLRSAVQSRLVELEACEREEQDMLERQRRINEWNRELSAVEAEIRRTDLQMDTVVAEWSAWLDSNRLSAKLTPDRVPELLHLAEQGQEILRRRIGIEARIAAIEQIQTSFRETAAALFRVCPPPDALADDPALAVAWLRRQSMEQRSVKEEAERLDRQLRESETAEVEAQTGLELAEAQLAERAAEAGEPDEAALERRLAIDERRRALARDGREIEVRLEAGKTPEALVSLRELLASHDEASLAALYRLAEEERQAAVAEHATLLDSRGRLSAQLERLREEAETEDRLQRLADLESKIAQVAERYAVLALADRLLRDTKKIYEEEKQPEVLRLASRYFADMTEGAYTRIMVPGDKPQIRVETQDRRHMDSAFLSRGAQEQLYLAMRFALADAASREAPLPLLLDDLFVHFDERRLSRTIGVLGQLANTRQILLFTCHRHVAEAVSQSLPAARIMHWEARSAEGRVAASDPDR